MKIIYLHLQALEIFTFFNGSFFKKLMGKKNQNIEKKKKYVKYYRPIFKNPQSQIRQILKATYFKFYPHFYIYPKSFFTQVFCLFFLKLKKNFPQHVLTLFLISIVRYVILNNLRKELIRLISISISKKGCSCNFEFIYSRTFTKKIEFTSNDSFYGNSSIPSKIGITFKRRNRTWNEKYFFRFFYFLNLCCFKRDLKYEIKKNNWNFGIEFALPRYRILFDLTNFKNLKTKKCKPLFFLKKRQRVIGWNTDNIPAWLSRVRNLHREFKCDVCEGKYFRGLRAFYSHFSGTTHLNFLKKYNIHEIQSRKLKGISNKKDIMKFLNVRENHVSSFFFR